MKKILFYMIAVLMVIGVSGSTGRALEADVLGGVDIHGFISQGFLISDEYNYLAHNSEDGSFEYSEVGINFSKQVGNKLRLGVQLFTRDLGDAANHKITLDWAYGDYRWQDWLGFRAGKIKLPLGMYNETRDVDMLRTNIVMPQGIYNDLIRDNTISLTGASVYGNLPMGPVGSMGYQLIVGAPSADNDSGLGKYADNTFRGVAYIREDPDYDTGYAGALRWSTPLEGLTFGASYYMVDVVFPMAWVADDSLVDFEGEYFFHIYSVEYVWNNLTLAFEYMLRESDVTILGTKQTADVESYYLLSSYRFTDWFELGAYYSVTYPNKDDKDGDLLKAVGRSDHGAWEKDLALSFRFDITDNLVFKVEGHLVDGTANVVTLDNPGNFMTEEDWYYGAAKVTFSF